MAQLDGRMVRAWLASSDADPELLLDLVVEAKFEDVGGKILDVSPDGFLLQTEGGRRVVRLRELDRWVLQDVPAEVAERIASAVTGIPASHAQTLRERGFDSPGLAPPQARLVIALLDALDAHREADFEMVEAVGLALGAPAQHRAARRLLEAVIDAPFPRASGSARIRLASDAGGRGDVSRVKALTEAALPRNRGSADLTEDARGILLTIRAACLGRFALDCQDLGEARQAADAAFAILGRTQRLTTTYAHLRKRAEALRCSR